MTRAMGWKQWKNQLCRSNTNLEKVLICCVIILSVIILVLFVCFLTDHANHVCNNPQCVRAAVHILDTVDPTADPCDDFYQFACGTFLKNAFSFGQPTTLHSLSELTKNQLKEIVMETRNETTLPKTVIAQRRFYRSCINTTAIEEDKDRTFMQLLDQVTGGWPVVKSYTWMERDFEWSQAMIKARKMGFYYQFFFHVGVHLNQTNDRNILWIKPPFKLDVSSFHWKEKNIAAMTEIAKIMGSPSASVTGDLRRTMYFVEQLEEIIEKNINSTLEEADGKIMNISIKNLDHRYIKIDWLDYLRNITGIQLNEDDRVVFAADDYLKDLYYLLLKTPKTVQANYMAWAIISTNSNYLTKKIRETYRNITKYSNDSHVNLKRNDLCFELSKTLFKNVAESEYIRRYVTPEKKAYIHELIDNIKKEMAASLKRTSWLDQETKERATKQLKNITESVGWTDIVFNIQKFDRTFGYNKLKMPSGNVVDMSRTVAKNVADHYYEQINRSYSYFDRMVNSPKLDVNAYFLQYFNKLILPAPILQGQIFDAKRPRYMNYGSLGTIVGHEFTHGFSAHSRSAEYEDGFWTNGTTENFENVSRCLIDEYDNYQKDITGFSTNGTDLEENLADFTGLNLAYRAYQNWVRSYGDQEDSLPGIKFTPNQIFWIMASTYMCYEPKLSYKDEVILNDSSHAVPSFRVVGRLRNSPHFAKDFNCAEGSKMNPKRKCQIFA